MDKKIVLLSVLLCFKSVAAAELTTYYSDWIDLRNGSYQIKRNLALDLQKIEPGALFEFRLPNNKLLQFSVVGSQLTPGGTVSFYAKNMQHEIASFSTSGQTLFGELIYKDETYKIETRSGITTLFTPDYREKGISTTGQNDVLVPPRSKQSGVSPKANPPASSKGAGLAQIDLMFVYTNEFAIQFGSGLNARLAQLVNSLNATMQASDVDASFRLVHSESTTYSNDGSTPAALMDLTEGRGEFLNIESVRRSNRADMVVMLRRYTIAHVNEGLCGFAWINGIDKGRLDSFDADFAYSVVQLGRVDTSATSFRFCDAISLAHEIGHNLGLQHERANVAANGVFPYSHGYDVVGVFSTIMSTKFTGRKQMLFSNPRLNCNSVPCGIGVQSSNSADSALSLNNVAHQAAGFISNDLLISPIIDLLLDN